MFSLFRKWGDCFGYVPLQRVCNLLKSQLFSVVSLSIGWTQCAIFSFCCVIFTCAFISFSYLENYRVMTSVFCDVCYDYNALGLPSELKEKEYSGIGVDKRKNTI